MCPIGERAGVECPIEDLVGVECPKEERVGVECEGLETLLELELEDLTEGLDTLLEELELLDELKLFDGPDDLPDFEPKFAIISPLCF